VLLLALLVEILRINVLIFLRRKQQIMRRKSQQGHETSPPTEGIRRHLKQPEKNDHKEANSVDVNTGNVIDGNRVQLPSESAAHSEAAISYPVLKVGNQQSEQHLSVSRVGDGFLVTPAKRMDVDVAASASPTSSAGSAMTTPADHQDHQVAADNVAGHSPLNTVAPVSNTIRRALKSRKQHIQQHSKDPFDADAGPMVKAQHDVRDRDIPLSTSSTDSAGKRRHRRFSATATASNINADSSRDSSSGSLSQTGKKGLEPSNASPSDKVAEASNLTSIGTAESAPTASGAQVSTMTNSDDGSSSSGRSFMNVEWSGLTVPDNDDFERNFIVNKHFT
jgi:hypothetical protein